jgi:hypothetical protein
MFPGIGTYKGKALQLKVAQSVGDIMAGILATHKRYTTDYDKISPTFDGGSIRQISQRLYNYLLERTHYKVEPDDRQTLRSPAAILALGGNPAHGLDCKSYSLFIGGVLDALNRRGHNIKWCYRFASYRFGDKLPHHVFVVVNPGTKNEIFVDPVIQPFNYKKPYFYKIDKYPNMALYSISGTRRQQRRAERSTTSTQARKEAIKQKIRNTGKVALKFAPVTAIPRNSFLLLVKLNVFKLRDKLRALQAANPAKLRQFWEGVGGNMLALLKAMQGKNSAQVGVEPATTTAAAVATATPLIIKILKLLKEAGIDTKDLAEFATSVVKKAIDKKAEQEAGSEIATDPAQFMAEESGEDSSGNDSGNEDFTFEGSSEESIGGIPKNTVLLVGAGALAIYLFTRKRR